MSADAERMRRRRATEEGRFVVQTRNEARAELVRRHRAEYDAILADLRRRQEPNRRGA